MADRLHVRCPACGSEGEAPSILSAWDGHTYLFACCRSRHHLDEAKGGAKTWLEPEEFEIGGEA